MKNDYKREVGYDMSDEFIDAMSLLDVRTGIKVGDFIKGVEGDVPVNQFISTVLGGFVVDDDNDTLTFAVEIIKNDSEFIILSDLIFIPMDDYLDLIHIK